MSQTAALVLCGRLIALAMIVQMIEMLWLGKTLTRVWQWDTLKTEYTSKPIQKILTFLLRDENLFFLILIGLVSALIALLFPSAWLFALMFLVAYLISIRWRGTFNGGSDYMSLVVLGGVTVAFTAGLESHYALACLCYIVVQLCLSYFISGVSKILKSDWRSGAALKNLLLNSNYGVPNYLKVICRSGFLFLVLSWLMLIFECSFPIASVVGQVTIPYLISAFIFHLSNAYAFGLNRFLWAWIAAFPALYFCSHV